MAAGQRISDERKREVTGVVVLCLSALLCVVLVADGQQGVSGRSLDGLASAPHALGPPGAIAAGLLVLALGHAAHIVYSISAVWAFMLLRKMRVDRLVTRIPGLAILVLAMACLLDLTAGSASTESYPGGIAGSFLAHVMQPNFGWLGSSVIMSGIALIGLLLSTEFLVVHCIIGMRNFLTFMAEGLTEIAAGLRTYWLQQVKEKAAFRPARRPARRIAENAAEAAIDTNYGANGSRAINIRTSAAGEQAEPDLPFDAVPEDSTEAAIAAVQAIEEAACEQEELPLNEDDADLESEIETASKRPEPALHGMRAKKDGVTLMRKRAETVDELPPDYEYPKVYTKPPLDLLEEAPEFDRGDLTDELRAVSAKLEDTFKTFGIEAHVTDVVRGPTITRFELEPAPGIKVSRFLALGDDIALAMRAKSVRVEAPIPGKGRVGIEVPNPDREPVVLRELLESRTFKHFKGTLPLALGKNIAGDVDVANLATMPHLLVAGATGSGKTVAVKAMLASLLYRHSPEEMQLMLIDPKMVELSIFDDIPHLITPVVTDPKKAAAALNWLIVEMEERYRLFAHLRVRNIDVYNDSVDNGEIEMAPEAAEGEEAPPPESIRSVRKLPYIVAVIDELADLMMLARGEVENAIARLAQLARAVGIHLILATQRPSVDVLTGVIKANFPARMSFQVSSRVDSRCILDIIGAERLIGMGDMLYMAAGSSKPQRIQGAFVSDAEMERLIAHLKRQAPPQYRDEIQRFGQDKEKLELLADEEDELLDDAIRVVLDTGQASISMVQRKLRVGYTRAARLIDMMEVRGVVGPHVGSKPREILMEAPTAEGDEVA